MRLDAIDVDNKGLESSSWCVSGANPKKWMGIYHELGEWEKGGDVHHRSYHHLYQILA